MFLVLDLGGAAKTLAAVVLLVRDRYHWYSKSAFYCFVDACLVVYFTTGAAKVRATVVDDATGAAKAFSGGAGS